jgi:hypothetical protein
MKERGRYQIQCMKSRSSTGVGQKIDLEYNIETMRITDPGLDENSAGGPPKSFSIMSQIKNKVVAEAADALEGPAKFERATGVPAWEQKSAPQGEAQTFRLKNMLAGLKSKAE